MKRLFALVLSRGVLYLLGVGALAAIVWFAGPLLSFAGWFPLESESARWLLIAVLLLLGILRRMWRALMTRRHNARMLDAIGESGSGGEPAPAHGEAAEVAAMRQRFEKAIALIRTARLGQPENPSFWQRLQGKGRYVYQLPWYLFIGAPGSGKTTALLNSGLRFPLADHTGQTPVRGIGGTRHCDWWFTDEAVLIDTAGRYTTQDSDAAVDRREWAAFIDSLRRFRPREPINGVILTFGADELISRSAEELERHAGTVLARLAELEDRLGVRFPVYVLVTKLDLVQGFTEFFDSLAREARSQVWGITMPHHEKPSARGFSRSAFDAEYAALVRRLTEQTLDRLQAEKDPARRSLIFHFPAQVASLLPALSGLLGAVFEGAQAKERKAFIRGVFLTSATQEGHPIDRVMAALGRRFAIQGRVIPPPPASARAYFLDHMLRRIVFVESPLAGTNLAWRRRHELLRWGASGLALVIGGASIAAWTLSYFGNRQYVEAVGQKVESLAATLESGRVQTDLRSLPPLYRAIRELPRTEAVDPASPRWSVRMGLYQGEKFQDAAQQAYHDFLAETLAPEVGRRIERVLKAGAGNPEFFYETLKVYLMLGDADRRDRTAIKAWLATDLQADAGSGFDAAEQASILGHLDELLRRESLGRAISFDTDLVERARAIVAASPFPRRVYDRLRREATDERFPEFRIDRAGGNAASLVFTRRSGRPLSEGVVGFYSYDGYYKGFLPSLERVLNDLAAEEEWVLGIRHSPNARRALDPATRPALLDEVKRLYLREYADVWGRFVADIALVPSASMAQTIQSARILSGADSPLPRLLRAIVHEVTLVEAPTKPEAGLPGVDRAASALKEMQKRLQALRGQPVGDGRQPRPEKVEAIVDERFDALRRYAMASAEGVPAPVDQTIALLNDVYQLMLATESAIRSGSSPAPSSVTDRVRAEAGRMPSPVREMVVDLAESGTREISSANRGSLAQELVSQVTEPCERAISGRYPFSRDSPVDVPAGDFARIFGPGGVMDSFFQTRLAPMVDTAGRNWRLRSVDDKTIGSSLVQFQRAAEIRRAFFEGRAEPRIRVSLKPVEMDPELLQFSLDLDDQRISYAHGPSRPQVVQWPGPGGSQQIRMEVVAAGSGTPMRLSIEGPWALMRLMDRATIEPSSQPERFRARFVFDGKPVVLEVTASSVDNPLRLGALARFRCPSRL